MTFDTANWESVSLDLFEENGFVVLPGALSEQEYLAVLEDCKAAAKQFVGPKKAGNRGPGRYSFGVASSTMGMLHAPSFSEHLLTACCDKLYPLLDKVFPGGFLCAGSGGDFVVGRTETDQSIHADIQVEKEDDCKLPPPMVSVNFTVEQQQWENGPMRMIPGTWDKRGDVPENPPAWWSCACLCPLSAGTAIVRDVRVLHSGTRNTTIGTRYLPSVEFVSQRFRKTNRKDCFPLPQSMPHDTYKKLHRRTQELCREITTKGTCKFEQHYNRAAGDD